eukprot:2687537-Pyramimonas_sp.AAC.1
MVARASICEIDREIDRAIDCVIDRDREFDRRCQAPLCILTINVIVHRRRFVSATPASSPSKSSELSSVDIPSPQPPYHPKGGRI